MSKTYTILTDLPGAAAVERIRDLLSKEGVAHVTSEVSVVSTKTPLVVSGVQSKLYTHQNWLGLNPFAFVTGVSVTFARHESGVTAITLLVNRRRAWLWVVFWVVSSALASSSLPQVARPLLVGGSFVAAWLGVVLFLGGYLVRKEIGDCLGNRRDVKRQGR